MGASSVHMVATTSLIGLDSHSGWETLLGRAVALVGPTATAVGGRKTLLNSVVGCNCDDNSVLGMLLLYLAVYRVAYYCTTCIR